LTQPNTRKSRGECMGRSDTRQLMNTACRGQCGPNGDKSCRGTRWQPLWACRDSSLDGGRKISEGSTTALNLGWLTSLGNNNLDDRYRWPSLSGFCIRNAGISPCHTVLVLLCCVSSHVLTYDRLYSLAATRTDFIWTTLLPPPAPRICRL
jgi:hypothetical protein